MSTKIVCSFLGLGIKSTLKAINHLTDSKTKFIHSGFTLQDLTEVLESNRYDLVMINFGEALDCKLYRFLIHSTFDIDWIIPNNTYKGKCVENVLADGLSNTQAHKHFYFWDERLLEVKNDLANVINQHRLNNDETLLEWCVKRI